MVIRRVPGGGRGHLGDADNVPFLFFFFFFENFIEVELIDNVLISSVQQNDSII